MFFNDTILFFIFIHVILIIFFLTPSSSLSLLVLMELLWINLYVLTSLLAFWIDSTDLLALPFFFLIFSALELGFGLLLITWQLFTQRSLSIFKGFTSASKPSTSQSSLRKF